MKSELIGLSKENCETIAKYFSALNPLQMKQANKEIENDKLLSSFFKSQKDELIAGLEKTAQNNIFNLCKEYSFMIKMPFFRDYLNSSHNADFLRAGLLKKNYKIIKLASEKEWAKTIHRDLFYEEVNRLESDNEGTTIDKNYLDWYENLISHLPEEKKMKCLIGLLCVSISQSYRSAFSDISKKLDFNYKEVNNMPMSKRMEMITILKEKVHFEHWSDSIKKQLNSLFTSPLSGLSLHSLSTDIEEWVKDLHVVVLHTKLDKNLEDKLPEVKKAKI